jgi:hypothetical protein
MPRILKSTNQGFTEDDIGYALILVNLFDYGTPRKWMLEVLNLIIFTKYLSDYSSYLLSLVTIAWVNLRVTPNEGLNEE